MDLFHAPCQIRDILPLLLETLEFLVPSRQLLLEQLSSYLPWVIKVGGISAELRQIGLSFVYPFVRTREWYSRTPDQRQEMMDEHIRIGTKYRSVKLHTTYSFGLDDQEFVVAFETDNPADFLDLVQELRETKASSYTLRDTPMFTCRQRTPAE